MPKSFYNGKCEIRKSSGSAVNIMFAGDSFPQEAPISATGGDWEGLFRQIKPLMSKADLRLVQFETPVTTQERPAEKCGALHKCPPEFADFVKAGSFDAAMLANNHLGDYGPEGVVETLERFRKIGIPVAGAGGNLKEAQRPLILEKNSLRIAVLNAAEHEFGTAEADKPGVAPLEISDMLCEMKRLEGEVDIIVAILHGGTEHNPVPSPRLMRTCRALVAGGANAVINIHPHCPAGIEIFDGSPIIYSPGNFYFPAKDPSYLRFKFWTVGYLPLITFDRKGAVSVEVIPYRFDHDGVYPLSGEAEKGFLGYLSRLSDVLSDFGKVEKYFEGWSARHGEPYLGLLLERLKTPVDLKSPDYIERMLAVRNCFTCEAHHEAISVFLRLLETQRVDQAMLQWKALQELQRVDFIEGGNMDFEGGHI